MQDIPRNELLDKLAAGWKCRRKSWEENPPHFLSLKENEIITPLALVADDWEGEPPTPARKHEGCSIIFAFEHLQRGAAFIRRTAWVDREPITLEARSYVYVLHLDILANDWEVWG